MVASGPPRPAPGVREAAYGAEIRARAASLRRRYPDCGIEYIVHSLEYELGLRAGVIRRVLERDEE